MKRSGLLLVLVLSAGVLPCTKAQIAVEVTMEQEQFLLGESLPITVRITNRSGQALHLGGEEEWLTFAMEAKEGVVVPKLGEVPVLGEFVLESAKVAVKRLDLAPYFALTTSGRYGIVATVHIKAWGYDKVAPPKFFTIIQGAKIWEQDVGVPSGDSGLPEVRKYILQQANYITGQLRLYLRVTDSYGRTFRVFPIGQMVSFGRPDAPQVDKRSNLHVLYQNGATSFSYTVFNLDGDLLIRQTYDYINSRPKLRGDDQGNVSVAGGVRRVTSNDVPVSMESADASSKTNPPAAANSRPSEAPQK